MDHSHVDKQLNEIRDLKGRSSLMQNLSTQDALSAVVTRGSRSVCDVVDLIVVVAGRQG